MRIQFGLKGYRGSCLSPHLFNIYINDLITQIAMVDPSVWAFADDLAFGFRCQQDYNIKMGIIEQWCTLNDAVLNKDKCDVMVINSASLTSSLSLRKEVKYLGSALIRSLVSNPTMRL